MQFRIPVEGLFASHDLLGHPFIASGSRGDVEDPFLDLKTPTLFVIGQQAPLSPLADVEDLRERIKAETSLVLVGGADDQLRMCRRKKKMEGITQVSSDCHSMIANLKNLTIRLMKTPQHTDLSFVLSRSSIG